MSCLLVLAFISFLVLWSMCVVSRRADDAIENADLLRRREQHPPVRDSDTCEICGDIRAKSKMHFSANQTHEIIGICEKCWNKEPKG